MEIEMEKENKRRGEFIDDDLKKLLVQLPPDIITEILSRLPADSAIGCRCICKQWRSLIDHPSFVDTHTRQLISSSSNPKKFGNYLIPNSSTSSSSSFFVCAKLVGSRLRSTYKLELIEYNDGVGDEKSVLEFKPFIKANQYDCFNKMLRINSYKWMPDTMLMISSCNGLVLMGSAEPNDMLVCNPFTREHVILDTPIRVDTNGHVHGQSKGYMVYGFGYHPNEYKVVCIYYDAKRENKGKVSVYTIGSGEWRNKGEIPYLLNVTSEYPGMFANGAIHWLTYNNEIVSFDLADEEFRVVIPLLPPSPNSIDKYWVLGGCLCASRSDKRSESPRDIWVLNHVLTSNHNNNKEEEEEKEEFSWNKKFSIPGKGINPWAATAPLIVLKSGKILFRCVDGLATYDPKSEAFVEGEGNFFLGDNTSKIILYTKSFVSLKALGEEQ